MSNPLIHPAEGYAGDISPQTAYEWMQRGHCALVDVRTDAEREWVGFVPGAYAVAWKQWPGMKPNEQFEQELLAVCEKAGVKRVALLCRWLQRSLRPTTALRPTTFWRALKGILMSKRTAHKRADGRGPACLGSKTRKALSAFLTHRASRSTSP